MTTKCIKRMVQGVADFTYIERRLDEIEARIDDLCGLLSELLERIDKGQSLTEIDTTSKGGGYIPARGLETWPDGS